MRYTNQKNICQYSYRLENMDGIDRSSFADDTTLYDAYNLTSDGRPFWKTRPARGRWHRIGEDTDETNSGLFVFNSPISGACTLEEGLCWTTGTKIYIGGKEVKNVTLTATPRKQLLAMGRDLFVIPDGALLHKNENGEWIKTAASERAVALADNLRWGSCNADASCARPCTASMVAPNQPDENTDWLDISVSPAVLKTYSSAESAWKETIPQAWYLMISGLHKSFRTGDVIDIDAAGSFGFRNAVITSVTSRQLVVQGEILSSTKQGNMVEIGRNYPVIDYAVVCGNRVWGCRYGENQYGEFVNEIFCSALGDPLTWSRFGTGADDCYCASLGTAGSFTGAAVLYDDVLFFKENAVFCVSGNEPVSFHVASNEGKGVRNGCERSIARLGSNIVYCGTDGVYRTNGTYTLRLCDGLLPIALENAVGGVIGEKYYLAAHTQENEKRMYVFTAGKDTYHTEDNNVDVQFFIPQRNCLYMICMPTVTSVAGIDLFWILLMITDCNAPGKYTNCLLEDGKDESDYGYVEEKDLQWYALTSEIDCGTDETKCIREINLRFELGDASLLCVELHTDRGEIKELARFTGKGLRRRTMHVRCLPCEDFRLYFSGCGTCTIREVDIVYETMKGEQSRV